MHGSDAMKTYSAKPSDIDKKWLVIDADGLVLGRLASQVAMILRIPIAHIHGGEATEGLIDAILRSAE